MRRVTDRVGELQMFTGVVHLGLGLVGFRRTLAAIARDGVVGVSDGDWERETAVWFLTSGAAFLAAGQLARWAQRRMGTLPAAYGASLLTLGLTGALVMPRSGFWAVAANGLLALTASRSGDAPATVAPDCAARRVASEREDAAGARMEVRLSGTARGAGTV